MPVKLTVFPDFTAAML